jgi:hypothetical protein
MRYIRRVDWHLATPCRGILIEFPKTDPARSVLQYQGVELLTIKVTFGGGDALVSRSYKGQTGKVCAGKNPFLACGIIHSSVE